MELWPRLWTASPACVNGNLQSCLLNVCFNLVPFLVTVIVTKKPQKQATAARRKQGNGSHLDGAARQLGSLSTKAENKRNDLELSVKGEC